MDKSDQGQGEGAGRTGESPGVSGMSALATAPESSLTASSPSPLSPKGDDRETNFNPVVIDPVFVTPVKRKQRTASSTPTSADSQSSRTSAKKKRMLLPSPGKRYLQAQPQAQTVPQTETVEEIAEMVALGEVCHEPAKVSKK